MYGWPDGLAKREPQLEPRNGRRIRAGEIFPPGNFCPDRVVTWMKREQARLQIARIAIGRMGHLPYSGVEASPQRPMRQASSSVRTLGYSLS
jgi:hypothetical protein